MSFCDDQHLTNERQSKPLLNDIYSAGAKGVDRNSFHSKESKKTVRFSLAVQNGSYHMGIE